MDTAVARELESPFVVPPWGAPLDVEAAIRSIPPDATISGMFLAPLCVEAKRRGVVLPTARERYVPFHFYPLREHARLLVETCERVHCNRPIREALRKLGRGAPQALVASTLGKVVLGSVDGVEDVIAAMAKAYPINARPSRVTIVECIAGRGHGRAVVTLEEVHYFLDSHHVGAFEGVLKYAGVSGSVRIRPRGKSAADLLLEWTD